MLIERTQNEAKYENKHIKLVAKKLRISASKKNKVALINGHAIQKLSEVTMAQIQIQGLLRKSIC